MAVAVIGAPSSAYGATPDVGARPAGADRLLLIGTGIEQDPIDNGIPRVTSMSIGGQSLTHLPNASVQHTNATIYNVADVFYATETQIAAMSNGAVTIAWDNTVNVTTAIATHWIFLSGVDQSNPIVDSDSGAVSNSTAVSTPALTTVADGYVWAYTNNGGDTTHDWSGGPLTELLDPNASPDITFSDSSAGAVGTGGAMTPSAVLAASQSRIVMGAVSVRPVANATFANPLTLLGVGRAA